MADAALSQALVSLCKQCLVGDPAAIKAVEANMVSMLQPQSPDLEVKLASIFKIILAPTFISNPIRSSNEADPGPLEGVDVNVQLWMAIFLKNYIKANFETSESYGGVSEHVHEFVKHMLLVSTLNSNALGVNAAVARQVFESLSIIADVDFPNAMEYILLYISFVHLSDVNSDVLTSGLSQAIIDAVALATSRSGGAAANLGASLNTHAGREAVIVSLDPNKNAHLLYADKLLQLLEHYVGLHATIRNYGGAIKSTMDPAIITKSYLEVFNTLVQSVKNMSDVTIKNRLKNLNMGQFLQGAKLLVDYSPSTTIALCNFSNKSVQVSVSSEPNLFYFDDRYLYCDSSLWSFGSLPPLGSANACAQLIARPSEAATFPTNLYHLKRKMNALVILRKLMKKYKSRVPDEDVIAELKVFLTLVDSHLVYMFKYCINKACEEYGSVMAYSIPLGSILVEAITAITKIFCYTHAIDLPECFEDNVETFFNGLIPQLSLKVSTSEVRKLKIAICRLLLYYADRYQEVFTPFCFTCIHQVSALLKGLNGEDEDKLVSSGLNFLSAAGNIRWSGEGNPFLNADFVRETIADIVLVNVGLTEADFYTLEDSPIEFVHRELDVGTGHDRRCSAMNFLKRLFSVYDDVVAPILNDLSSRMMQQSDVKYKELYIQLIICSNVKQRDFNVHAYFVQYLKGDLILASQRLDVDQGSVLLVLAMLKFLCTFCKRFPANELTELVPVLSCFLRHTSEAIRFFACETLCRFLPLVKQFREQLKPVLLKALEFLCQMLQQQQNASSTSPNASHACNEFYIKATMRIFSYLRQQIREAGIAMVELIVNLIKSAASNPTNPIYNHYLFESMGLLLKIHLDPRHGTPILTVEKLEQTLMPTLAWIIQQEMHAFIPYSLQLLQMLLNTLNAASPIYLELLGHLMSLGVYKSSVANAQGAARLLRIYFYKHSLYDAQLRSSMESILNIFHYMLTHRKLGQVGCELLQSIATYLPLDYYGNFIPTIVTVLFTFMHENKKAALLKNIVVTLSMVQVYMHMGNHHQTLVDVMESIQQGVAVNFIQVVYIPNAKAALELQAKKIHAIAAAKMLTCPVIQVSQETSSALLQLLADLVSGNVLAHQEFDDGKIEVQSSDTDYDYDVAFVKLSSAKSKHDTSLLNPSINAEALIRQVLAPIASNIKSVAAVNSNLAPLLALL